jgi:hypothetical protein
VGSDLCIRDSAIRSDFYGLVFLAFLAIVASEASEPTIAARLLGAVEQLCRASGLTVPTIARPEHKAALAAIRAILGDESFARAWAMGEALTLDEALGEAQRMLDRLMDV